VQLGKLEGRVIAACSLLMTAFVLLDVARRWAAASSESAMAHVSAKDVADLRRRSILVGNSTMPERSVFVFVDFTCPHCATFASALESYRSRHPGFNYRVVHFPIGARASAVLVAEVVQCAASHGHVEDVMQRAYQSVATVTDLGVPDTSLMVRRVVGRAEHTDAVLTCVREGRARDQVLAGREIAHRLGVRATPTLAFARGLMPPPADLDDLEAFMQRNAGAER
jgi:protein-disulfide isomerase